MNKGQWGKERRPARTVCGAMCNEFFFSWVDIRTHKRLGILAVMSRKAEFFGQDKFPALLHLLLSFLPCTFRDKKSLEKLYEREKGDNKVNSIIFTFLSSHFLFWPCLMYHMLVGVPPLTEIRIIALPSYEIWRRRRVECSRCSAASCFFSPATSASEQDRQLVFLTGRTS